MTSTIDAVWFRTYNNNVFIPLFHDNNNLKGEYSKSIYFAFIWRVFDHQIQATKFAERIFKNKIRVWVDSKF
jgi:hypothetical protein